MNLLKLLAPFAKHLDAFEKGFGMSDREAMTALVDIWDAFKIIPANAKIIYQNENMRAPKTDKGCQSCVEEALKSLVNWRRKLVKDEMSFKGDADQPVMAKVDEPKKTGKGKKAADLNAEPTKEETDKAPKEVTDTIEPKKGVVDEPKSEETETAKTDDGPKASETEANPPKFETADEKIARVKMPALKRVAKEMGVPYNKTTTRLQLIDLIKAEATAKNLSIEFTAEEMNAKG